jgi:16S rRNA (guanine966-N2)-methyltransferase
VRIIAGEHRGRQFLGPADLTTRPITDRVKQALFDRLAAADRIHGAHVLDLFSGTGSMGLECLSRYAETVTFVERDRDAVKRLRQNIDTLGLASSSTVLSRDALGRGLVAQLTDPLSLLFLDPPYSMLLEEPAVDRFWEQMTNLATGCAAEALAVLRSKRGTEVRHPEGWQPPVEHRYGSMTLHFYERS